MSNPATTHIEMDLSDSEWEYEYDPQEMETFYVTLDLSSATPEALSRLQHGRSEATRGGALALTPDNHTGDQPATERRVSVHTQTDHSDRVQVLELNSKNPIVSYNGHLYSCSWSRTIGTDLILAQPNEQLPFEPMYQEAGFQIAALSNIRLVGRAANLMPKKKTTTSENSTLDAHAKKISIAVPETASDDQKKQAAFLERIVTLKREKGDKDEVFIAKGRSYADYPPRSEQSQDPDERSGLLVNARETEQKGKGKVVLQTFGGGVQISESSSAPSNAAGPSVSVDAEDGDFTDEGEGNQLPTVLARVVRYGEASSNAIETDVEMRDAG